MSKKPLLYSIGKMILGPIYRWYYNPKIIGKENLRIENSYIIASNHIHLYDQCNTIISTKRFIKYLAKKEYFDSKKTGWFFKSVNCIPVDRENKDENSKKEAIKELEEGGVIGIFPEGTRNRLKSEKMSELYQKYEIEGDYKNFKNKEKDNKLSQVNFIEKLEEENKVERSIIKSNIENLDYLLQELLKKKIITEDEYLNSQLLDLKFGVVSLAQKTNSYIVPCIITGNYRFRSKNLIVRYGTPFKVNDNLEEANNDLRIRMLKLLKENERM